MGGTRGGCGENIDIRCSQKKTPGIRQTTQLSLQKNAIPEPEKVLSWNVEGWGGAWEGGH